MGLHTKSSDKHPIVLLLRAAWAVAVVVVVIASLLPSDSKPMQALDQLEINDKLEHMAAYFALAFLPAIHEKKRFVVAAAFGAVALGVALEYGQLYLGWRDFEIGDMIADAAGVAVGVAVGASLRGIVAHRLGRG
jgi:VanZ family protein